MTPDGFYTPAQRTLQAEHGAEKLANTVFNAIVAEEIAEEHAGFIESRDFFFLATVDGSGMPTVSYKGGPPGLVHVVDPKTVVFPNYDGNGMFKSVGNAADTGKVGLLFIDMETPHRVRVQGTASVERDSPFAARYPGATLTVRVDVESCFLNCARYIHKHTRVAESPYVPDATGAQPYPSWKRIDLVQDSLVEADKGRAEAEGGTITMDEYAQKLRAGVS